MKLASLKSGRDGRLVLVSRDLQRCLPVPSIAITLQQLLDDWSTLAPRLAALYEVLNSGADATLESQPFAPAMAAAPLPRAFQWVDGSAYVNHVELVRKARGAEIPPGFWTDPLLYQGGSDDFLGACDPACFANEEWGIDLEAEVAVITGDVKMGSNVDDIRSRGDIRLLMLVNDWSLRNLIPHELAKGFGFYQSKPATSFSPVCVTPDELGLGWDGGKVLRPLTSHVNGKWLGAPECGVDMTFDFPQLIAHAARTRNLGAGTVVGSGTVSNSNRSVGSSCLVERRTLEVLAGGKAVTPWLRFGDVVCIEMRDAAGASIFGAIEQQVVALG